MLHVIGNTIANQHTPVQRKYIFFNYFLHIIQI